MKFQFIKASALCGCAVLGNPDSCAAGYFILLILMQIAAVMKPHTSEDSSKFRRWIKRAGWAGVAFFTIKGLVWLAIFYFGADALEGCMAKP